MHRLHLLASKCDAPRALRAYCTERARHRSSRRSMHCRIVIHLCVCLLPFAVLRERMKELACCLAPRSINVCRLFLAVHEFSFDDCEEARATGLTPLARRPSLLSWTRLAGRVSVLELPEWHSSACVAFPIELLELSGVSEILELGFGDFRVHNIDGLRSIVDGRCLQKDSSSADNASAREDPQKESVENHRHVFPVLLDLQTSKRKWNGMGWEDRAKKKRTTPFAFVNFHSFAVSRL